MRFNLLVLVIILSLSAAALPLSAGVHLTYQTTGSAEAASSQDVYVSATAFRIDIKGKMLDQSVIFRADKELLWIVDRSEKTYAELTKEDMKALRESVEEAMKMMEEQLQHLPPEQQEMMKQMMGEEMPGAEPALKYRKVASGEMVKSWKCDHYEATAGASKKLDLWTTDWDGLGVDEGEFKVLEGIGELFEGFEDMDVSFLQMGSGKGGEEAVPYAGFPVKMINYDDDGSTTTTQLSGVKTGAIPSDRFDLPPDLKKEEMPGGMMPY